jgi:hypothetical protein
MYYQSFDDMNLLRVTGRGKRFYLLHSVQNLGPTYWILRALSQGLR